MESTTFWSPMRYPVRACGSKYGQFDMDSMPPATTISSSPNCTAWAASPTAFSPEPHTLLMVIAATRAPQPPFNAACLAGFCPSPAWTTFPRIASSICCGSRPARRIASATTLPPSSGALNSASPPWNLPIGVRTADRITGVSTAHLQTTISYYNASSRPSLSAAPLSIGRSQCARACTPGASGLLPYGAEFHARAVFSLGRSSAVPRLAQHNPLYVAGVSYVNPTEHSRC